MRITEPRKKRRMSRETLREKRITEIVRQTPKKYFGFLTEERNAAADHTEDFADKTE